MPHKDPEARRKYFREYHIKNKAKKNATSKSHYHHNKDVYKERFRDYYQENGLGSVRSARLNRRSEIQEYDRQRNRKKLIEKYGLSEAEVPKILECEVCGSGLRVAFDHDHNTGNFRGFLCYRCNLALGYALDSSELLEKLAKYLRDRK